MASYLRIGSVIFAAAFSMSAFALPARADNATAALTEASKMIEQGIPVKAIEMIDAALASGKLPPESSAKALLMRAQAQEKLNKLAFALADYNSALWMEVLSAADKARAEQGRDRIGGKLGIVAEAAKKAPASGERANAGQAAALRTPTSTSSGTNVKSLPSEQRTSGIGGFINGIFGSSEAGREPNRVKPVAAAKPAAATKPERTKPASARAEKPVNVGVAQQVSPAAAPSSEGSGKFGIQFAALHSEDGAISEVERIAKKFGSDLAGRSPSVKILATNDGGTLYKIVAEPYERGEATAICELLKTKNLNCMIVSSR
jgi:hypothetical protein